jgi:hypothetical protein
MNYCSTCGEWFFQAHYCRGNPLTQKVPRTPGCVPVKTLTENDVRRIVREELAKVPPNAAISPPRGTD